MRNPPQDDCLGHQQAELPGSKDQCAVVQNPWSPHWKGLNLFVINLLNFQSGKLSNINFQVYTKTHREKFRWAIDMIMNDDEVFHF